MTHEFLFKIPVKALLNFHWVFLFEILMDRPTDGGILKFKI